MMTHAPRLLVAALAMAACRSDGLDVPPHSPSAADLGPGAIDLDQRACGTRGGDSCASGTFCELAGDCGRDDSGGQCMVVPGDCDFAGDKAPECGCNGVTYSNSCERRAAAVSLDHVGPCAEAWNACTVAGGYCEPGDFVQPTCKGGYAEAYALESQHPGLCGSGICCAPDTGDCQTLGCSPGSSCQGCLTPTGVDMICISNGAAC